MASRMVLCSACHEFKEGDLFLPDEEYLCYDCVTAREREEMDDKLSEEWIENYEEDLTH